MWTSPMPLLFRRQGHLLDELTATNYNGLRTPCLEQFTWPFSMYEVPLRRNFLPILTFNLPFLLLPPAGRFAPSNRPSPQVPQRAVG